jgi:hypothetical protein
MEHPVTQHRPLAVPLLSLILGTAALAAPARAETDNTLDRAAQMLHRAMRDAKDLPLSKSRDSGLIITALRSTKDKALLPLFLKLQQAKPLENQIYGMVAATLLTKEEKRFDLPLLLSSKDSSLIGSALASLIENDAITDAQLEKLAAEASEEIHKTMALSELSRRGKLKDRAKLHELLKSRQEEVRYYAAVTMLEAKDAPDTAEALSTLKEMSEKHDLRRAGVQGIMIMRVQKEKILAASPWVVQVAADEQNDEGLRYTAVSTLLALKQPDGPRIIADMIQKQKDSIAQVKLGLISLEFASELKPGVTAPLLQSRSQLAKSVATLAQKAAQGNDGTSDLVKLMKEGHPIVLDWALASSERGDAERKMALRTAIINQATIVDEQRGRDYERAAVAAQRILEDGGPAGRQQLASLVKGDNRAVAEAVLAGIYRSNSINQSELVLPVWETLSRSTSEETAANYAAIILAREGKMEPLAWLSGMVMGGTVQSQGFRGIAGWYYAKLQNQTDLLLKKALAD